MNLHPVIRKLAIIALAFLATTFFSTASAKIYLGPAVHLPPTPAFIQGHVVGVRSVPAYAPAIGGTLDDMGDVTCIAAGPVTRTKIYRVATERKYYDFLKVCGEFPVIDDWSNWEQLHVGQQISFRIQNASVTLLPEQCEKLGLIRDVPNPMEASLAMDPPSYPACHYKVTLANVRSPNSSWVFRVIGAGPAKDAEKTKIGVMYSSALAPPFS